jgi:cell division protease FtsH
MVCEWGMSEAMGPLTFGKQEEQIFLGREISKAHDYSQDTANQIDHEVKKFVMDNYARARHVLTEHKATLLTIADELLAREVLDADQVKRIVQGQPLEELPKAAPASDDSPRREAPERPGLVPALGKAITQE